jgi:hypothetical protein
MPNPKPLPTITGSRVPMTNRFSFGLRFGYPWRQMQPGDFFIVPTTMRSPEMVRQAACRRGKRHGERYQTKLIGDGILVLRLA